MASEASGEEGEQDWRLQAELETPEAGGLLHDLIGRLRGDDELAEQLESRVARDVVITHDGRLLFAYAPTQHAIGAAREAIEGALRGDGLAATVRVSHWDDERDRWQQSDPPPSPEEAAHQAAGDRAEDAVQTRSMVASSGRLVRAEFEQTMREWARKLDLRCEVIEHPHLLTTQVAFTVTGPKRRIDEFAQGLQAEGWAMVRTETAVMLSPL